MHVQDAIKKFRTFAQENPTVVLGALSAVVLGGAIAAGRSVSKSRSRTAKTRSSSAKTTSGRKATKRTLIEPHAGDKRYIRRDAKGRIKESVDVGRSLAADRRRHSKARAKKGQGDRGD